MFFQTLFEDFSDLTTLTKSDLCDDDKMNVESGRRFFSDDVLSRLKPYKGTHSFLSLFREFVEAFEDHTLSVTKKIKQVCSHI